MKRLKNATKPQPQATAKARCLGAVWPFHRASPFTYSEDSSDTEAGEDGGQDGAAPAAEERLHTSAEEADSIPAAEVAGARAEDIRETAVDIHGEAGSPEKAVDDSSEKAADIPGEGARETAVGTHVGDTRERDVGILATAAGTQVNAPDVAGENVLAVEDEGSVRPSPSPNLRSTTLPRLPDTTLMIPHYDIRNSTPSVGKPASHHLPYQTYLAC